MGDKYLLDLQWCNPLQDVLSLISRVDKHCLLTGWRNQQIAIHKKLTNFQHSNFHHVNLPSLL
jgi:hypothetical protein